MKYVLGGGKVASGFEADWIKTLVSMATDSSHRTIMGKTVVSCFSVVLIQSCSYYKYKSLNKLEFWTSQTTEYGVSCP